MTSSTDQAARELNLSNLRISDPVHAKPQGVKTKKTNKVIVDSWEDDVASSEEEQDHHENEEEDVADGQRSNKISHLGENQVEFETPYSSQTTTSLLTTPPIRDELPLKRPEKTTVAINRMIANSLGLRTKMTPEQRAFHQSQVENEKKRREAEKTKRLEEDRRKDSIWND